ncbi:hypothetical protein [Deinococcus pimensis]|uniref:hypothetical protein n=1 Tax=Deinococcus pimensis TaxID=309888 RepID=UPI0004892D89|nr:hypothetical protein [Deinococcus pimensis]
MSIGMTSSRPSGSTFGRLWAAEARQKGLTLLLGVVLIVLLDVLIAWRVENPQLRLIVAALIGAIPAVYWLFGGFAAFGPPTREAWPSERPSGIRIVLAKYAWLLTEVLVLALALLGSALYFVSGTIPLAEIHLGPDVSWRLGLLALAVLPVPPAIALLASVVGRTSRLRLLGGFAVFVLLWWVYLTLSGATGGWGALGEVRLSFASLPEEVCVRPQGCSLQVDTALVLLQPAFAAVLLWIAGGAILPDRRS